MLLEIATILVLTLWFVVPFIRGWREAGIEPLPPITGMQETAARTNIEEEVTVGDMVLHDMMNQDDAYDIGVIDFGD